MLIHDIYHPHPKVIEKDATVKDAMRELLKDEVNGAIVMDNGKIAGILSLQDIAAYLVPEEFRENIAMASAMYRKGFFQEMCEEAQDTKVSEVMRKEFMTVNLHTNIMAVAADFLKNDLYIVPVIENGTLQGIITRTQIKEAIAIGMGLISGKSE